MSKKDIQYLYVGRLHATQNIPLGYVLRYLKDSPYDIKMEIRNYLLARFLVPALMKYLPDQNIDWYASECSAQLDAWANSIRDHFGLGTPIKRNSNAAKSVQYIPLGQTDVKADEANHELLEILFEEQFSAARAMWGES